MSKEVERYIEDVMKKFDENRHKTVQTSSQKELMDDLLMEQNEGPGYHTV